MRPFTSADLQALARSAQELDQLAATARIQRIQNTFPKCPDWANRPRSRQIILDAKLRPILNEEHDIEPSVYSQILDDAKRRLNDAEEQTLAQRWQVPDSEGEFWTFYVSVFPHYPALSGGPVLFYCLQPDCCDWLGLRGTDFAADAELSRLIPAMHYMQEHFGRRPTLGQVAKTVHLSPFHFHRRFTELLAITPKHFLLEWQICRAKTLLAGGSEDLVDIARICGFAHQSHFTSRFKQATGLTPTRWRKMVDDSRSNGDETVDSRPSSGNN
jgi:AraC-like DNA-binding protein